MILSPLIVWKKIKTTLFYATEKYPNDNYFIIHFLIDYTKDMPLTGGVVNIFELNAMKEERIYIKQYDLKYDKLGAIYNSKETRYFYEVLG